jgi:molecular chaperone GrpE (heat shock protein)
MSSNGSAPTDLRERLMKSECELQSLRLELEEKERSLRSAQHELDVRHKQMESASSAMTNARTEQLFAELAGPVASFITQSYLFGTDNKQLELKDVIALGKRFVSCLKNHGLQIEGKVGETFEYNSNLHEPLSLGEIIEERDEVMVRIVGISYQGKILRRAGVLKVGTARSQS